MATSAIIFMSYLFKLPSIDILMITSFLDGYIFLYHTDFY